MSGALFTCYWTCSNPTVSSAPDSCPVYNTRTPNPVVTSPCTCVRDLCQHHPSDPFRATSPVSEPVGGNDITRLNDTEMHEYKIYLYKKIILLNNTKKSYLTAQKHNFYTSGFTLTRV